MKTLLILLIGLALSAGGDVWAGPRPAAAQTTTKEDHTRAGDGLAGPRYQIQPGDVLEISVWQEKDLQDDVVVEPDGTLSFPLVGVLYTKGKSVEVLRQEVTRRLAKYVPDAVVTVAVKQLLGNKIYVIGKVNKPGQFLINSYVDVMQALSMAGGTTPYADVNDIKILRRKDGKQVAIPFRYGQVEDGDNLEQNQFLKSGDVIVVP